MAHALDEINLTDDGKREKKSNNDNSQNNVRAMSRVDESWNTFSI